MSEVNRSPSSVTRLGQTALVVHRYNRPASISDSIVLIDKHSGPSSYEIVKSLKRLSESRKVGHAGTLDPMATGLLICMTGRATKHARTLVDLDKEYVGTLRLGETTSSYDRETAIVETTDPAGIERADVEREVAQFVGTITQTTPAFSAVRIHGEPLYKAARQRRVEKGPPRVVTINRFDILDKSGPDVRFSVSCSKGTYIRSLAHELGTVLGVGAHLVRLRRVRVGPFYVNDALTINDIAAIYGSNQALRSTGR